MVFRAGRGINDQTKKYQYKRCFGTSSGRTTFRPSTCAAARSARLPAVGAAVPPPPSRRRPRAAATAAAEPAAAARRRRPAAAERPTISPASPSPLPPPPSAPPPRDPPVPWCYYVDDAPKCGEKLPGETNCPAGRRVDTLLECNDANQLVGDYWKQTLRQQGLYNDANNQFLHESAYIYDPRKAGWMAARARG